MVLALIGTSCCLSVDLVVFIFFLMKFSPWERFYFTCELYILGTICYVLGYASTFFVLSLSLLPNTVNGRLEAVRFLLRFDSFYIFVNKLKI